MKFLLLPLLGLALFAQTQNPAMSSDERIASFEKALKATPDEPKVQAGLASAFIQKLRETTDFAYLNRASYLVDRMLAADSKELRRPAV